MSRGKSNRNIELAIEDLGDFLNEEFNSSANTNWQGLSLGYDDDSNDLSTSTFPFPFTPPILPKPANLEQVEQLKVQQTNSFTMLSRPSLEHVLKSEQVKVDQTTQEFGAFRIDGDKKPNSNDEQSPSESTCSFDETSKPSKKSKTNHPPNNSKRSYDEIQTKKIKSAICTPIHQDSQMDKGNRKKSRERQRRLEVNVKFEELVDLLGLSSKLRKSTVLQEAATCIRNLRKEKAEWRQERERMQNEMSKLATCLQYSHMDSMVKASPMNQMSPLACSSSGACFPINSGVMYSKQSPLPYPTGFQAAMPFSSLAQIPTPYLTPQWNNGNNVTIASAAEKKQEK